ncbi:maleylpyruvate isomerase family mycothiol-dependent enzyme [Nocardioides houyundeii]|uniref:maleylpyruvate isomerase family mycothiol-dependent enzyme n=1 Tax=Nocardioides houyundeii TaxID=2045452 RepID=UPI000DF46556|nr:maleylpyruvate isomerase family mycothiol-dependent enzyme [Nocardioides houyundeii]
MRPSAAEVWPVVHAERDRLADDLADLTAEQWRTPSLCAGWDVHDVLAHLVHTARTTRLSFARDMVMARGSFDRVNDRGITRQQSAEPRDTLASLRAASGLTRTPPANLATRLVEAIVHGEDIRRPLGIHGAYPHPATIAALGYQVRTPVSFGGGRERVSGLRLVEASSGTSWGDGPEVVGPALDLLLAVSGRPVAAARLTGDGAPRLLGGVA